MTDEQIEILTPIFNDLAFRKQEIVAEQTKHNKELFAAFEFFYEKKTSETLAFNHEIIAAYNIEKEKIREKNKTQSVLFNPLSFFNIGETMHSFLIAYLLNPNEQHGQGNLFLKLFLQQLKIEVHENDNWIVTAEQGRIDILIKRIHPHTVIVVENKSNYAGDQENQLYRYWFQEIYLPNQKKFGEQTVEKTTNNKHYQVIYLTPADWKLPSEHSMQKPVGYEASLPNVIPIKPQIWLFNREINLWLTNSIQHLHKDNHRLREYIKQYLEIWT